MSEIKMKSCPNPECKDNNSLTVNSLSCKYCGIGFCGYQGPEGNSEKEAVRHHNLMPRRSDSTGLLAALKDAIEHLRLTSYCVLDDLTLRKVVAAEALIAEHEAWESEAGNA